VTSSYGYDAIYQLLQVQQGGSTTESYTYDAVGNRLSSLGLTPYQYNASNELTSTPNALYAYDNNGNTTLKADATGSTTYAWNYENRLTQVTLPGTGGVVTFKYDPFGRRIQKSFTQGTTVNYLYDGTNLIEELDSGGNVIARYSQGENVDEPLAQLRFGTTSYYNQDGLGSVTSLSDSGGLLANAYSYDSFANQTALTGVVVNPFQYAAREFDQEIGSYYHRARYYNPLTGRFISEDPIRSGMDFYAFVRNNPPNLVDSFGLKDNASPWQVGWEWVTGRGPREHNFTDGDPFTELLRRHEHIQNLINGICNGSLPASGTYRYDLSGLQGISKYFRDYSTLLTGGYTGNLAVTYLGSYSLDYTVTDGTLNIHVENPSTISSATRPPYFGYMPWWNNYVAPAMDNLLSAGPMSATRQSFDFHESLKDKCGCRK
jgi:RHS repeat-associated protein